MTKIIIIIEKIEMKIYQFTKENRIRKNVKNIFHLGENVKETKRITKRTKFYFFPI